MAWSTTGNNRALQALWNLEGNTADMRIAVLPDCDEHLKQAIKATGAKKVDLNRAEALLWTISSQAGFPEELPDSIRWVQLKSAGVRPWLISKTIDDQRDWSAAGAYSEDVAEHAVGMLIALMRNFPYYAHAKTWTKKDLAFRRYGSNVLPSLGVVLLGEP